MSDLAAVDFKPSDVDLLGSFPPLCGTLGRTERELAATLLVRGLQERGDEWIALPLRVLGEVLGSDIKANREPIASLNRNPFCNPNMHDCVAAGFAEWTGGPPGSADHGVRFTSAGIEALRRWRRA